MHTKIDEVDSVKQMKYEMAQSALVGVQESVSRFVKLNDRIEGVKSDEAGKLPDSSLYSFSEFFQNLPNSLDELRRIIDDERLKLEQLIF